MLRGYVARLLEAEGPIRYGSGWRCQEITPDQRGQLTLLRDCLERRHAPAKPAVIMAHLARLANHWKNERGPAEWQALFEDYAHDLNGISEAHLVETIASHRKTKHWFPKISDLHEPAVAARLFEREDLRKVRCLLGIESPKPWERQSAELPGPYREPDPHPFPARVQDVLDSIAEKKREPTKPEVIEAVHAVRAILPDEAREHLERVKAKYQKPSTNA